MEGDTRTPHNSLVVCAHFWLRAQCPLRVGVLVASAWSGQEGPGAQEGGSPPSTTWWGAGWTCVPVCRLVAVPAEGPFSS